MSNLASYRFNKYRSNTHAGATVRNLTFFRPGLKRSPGLERSVRTAEKIIPGVFLARDLVNEPPSITTARFLGEQAKLHCSGRSLSVEVWGKKKIEAMQLAGLLAVNRGSLEEPRFIKIHYQPARKARKKVALIGKGIITDNSINTHIINELDIPITLLNLSNVIVAASPDAKATPWSAPSSEARHSSSAVRVGFPARE